jgi:hypothetical protein
VLEVAVVKSFRDFRSGSKRDPLLSARTSPSTSCGHGPRDEPVGQATQFCLGRPLIWKKFRWQVRLLEREPNPEYWATERSAEPLWLYQLTPSGEAWREELKGERAAFKATIR